MNLRRITATILCTAALAALLVGCNDTIGNYWESPLGVDPSAEYSYSPDGTSTFPGEETIPEYTDDETESFVIDYDAAFEAFAPDTVMMTIGGYTVTWAELFFQFRSNMNGIIQNYGEITDWSMMIDEEMTYADAIKKYAVEGALMYKAVEYGAKLNEVALDKEDEAKISADFEQAAEQYGGEETFLSMLWTDSGIKNRDLFFSLVSINNLANKIFNKLYGESGDHLSDSVVAEYTANDGYLMAKHILRLISEETVAEVARAKSEEILAMLNAYEGDDFEAYFDELMNEYTEDTDGLAEFPNGYLFQYGDMVSEFYEACNALDIGELSGIVETTYGFHILYRVPIDYDVIPSAYYNQYDYKTLRHIVAMHMFDTDMYGWVDALSPVYTEEFNSISVADIFAIRHEG